MHALLTLHAGDNAHATVYQVEVGQQEVKNWEGGATFTCCNRFVNETKYGLITPLCALGPEWAHTAHWPAVRLFRALRGGRALTPRVVLQSSSAPAFARVA